jgi:hypothetical protein
MKHLIRYIVIIILFGTACDKYEISSKQEETFVRYYGVGMQDEGLKVISTNDGFLIMANVANPGRGRDICIITTDKYGNTIAPVTTIGEAFDDIGYAIKPNSGGYIIAGSTQASQNGKKNVFVVQLRTDGSFEWQNPIDELPNNNEAYDVLVEDDGELIFTGYTEINEQRDIFFLKTNALADNIIEFSYKGNNALDEEAYSVVLWKDSTYMFAGYQRNSSGIKDITCWRWGGYNSIAIPLYYREPEGNSAATCIVNTSTEYKFLVACNKELSIDQSEILLLEIDTTMSVRNVIPSRLGERSMNIVESMAFRGNSLYLCGTASSGGQDYGDMMLIQLSKEGTNPKYYYIGDGASYTGSGFDLTNENGYIITGASYLNEKSMITLYKVNNEGEL